MKSFFNRIWNKIVELWNKFKSDDLLFWTILTLITVFCLLFLTPEFIVYSISGFIFIFTIYKYIKHLNKL